MSALIACGINHKTAPLNIREQFTFDPTKTATYLQEISDLRLADEVALLSTCNRTELYCQTTHQAKILAWLQARHKVLQPHLYCHQDKAAIQHMLRVANGLDSMILGEAQILGQMKSAFTTAQLAGTLGPHLQRLFQYIFAVSKQVRSDTSIGAGPVSVASTAVNLAKRLFTNLNQQHALLIGAGETIERVAKHLCEQKIAQITIANRTRNKAAKVAALCGGNIIAISDLHQNVPKADIIISATLSHLPIVGKGMIESALKQRHHRPMLIVDLAVPRDVEAEVSQLKDAYLYSIDDLQHIIADNLQDRRLAAQEAEQIIEAHSHEFLRQQRNLANVHVVRSYRQTAHALAKAELEQYLYALRQGQCPEQVLQQFAHSLTNKLLHEPTLAIKNSEQSHQALILAQARKLFSID